MTEIPRRTIAELIARYELEPELDDVYVEGNFDRELLGSFCQLAKINRAIYEIDTIDISAEMLKKHGMTSGKKQRVIVLARELSFLSGSPSYVCIVDRDTDHWLSRIEKIPRLIYTKYVAMELYFFYKEAILGIIKTIGKVSIRDENKFMGSFTNVLVDLYAIRLACEDLSLNLKWSSFDKYVKFDDDIVALDAQSYIHTLVLNNKMFKEEKDIKSKFNEWRPRLVVDPRLCIRGHDFVKLSCVLIRKAGRIKAFSEPEDIERVLVFAADRARELGEML
jgi:hypothetical protein